MCSRPFRPRGQVLEEFGCGQCLPCRFNRRRLWTGRIMLEAQLHAESSFNTLTYSEENYPDSGSVSVREIQLFLKRVRERISPHRIRYFAVGEYGDVTWRAHYHVVLFGLNAPDIVAASWENGFVHHGELTAESAAYAAGYTVKKLTSKDDFRLKGRHPEFARMSLRPGLGAGAVRTIADALVDPSTGEILHQAVPGQIRSAGKLYPLGRYLRSKLAPLVGYGETAQESARVARLVELKEELHSVSARDAREEKRLQVSRRAAFQSRLNKGGL